MKEVIHTLIGFLTWFIIIGSLLTWVPPHSRNRLIWKVINLTDKILKPIRALIPPIGGIDISPIVAIIILQIIDSIVRGL